MGLMSVGKRHDFHLFFFPILLFPFIHGEESGKCPKLTDNPVCPCYNFQEGLFLECPGTTASSIRSILMLINSPIQSLSIYDLDSSIEELSSNCFAPSVAIHHLQISQSNIKRVKHDAFDAFRSTLKTFSLASSKLDEVPNITKINLPQLKSLDLQLNDIEAIKGNNFNGQQLGTINLKGNRVKFIDSEAFNGLEYSLTDLDVTENDLSVFPFKAIERLKKLNTLRMAFNRIMTFNHDYTVQALSIQSLDMNSNIFINISNEDLSLFSNLHTLSFYNNRIKVIAENAFHGLEFLESLDLSHNKIVHLGNNIFQKNRLLNSIDLSQNHLHYIKGIFSNLYFLTEVFLTNNNILELSNNDFGNCTSLSILYLEQNALRYIESGTFSSLSNLTQLHMGTNFLTTLPRNVFKETYNLHVLSLDNNRLGEIEEGIFESLTILKELRLQSNQLIQIKRNVFSSLSELLELHLQNNCLQTVESNAFITLKKLQYINLQGNKITTVGDIFHSRNSSLMSIQLSNNSISLMKNTSLRGQTETLILWLDHNNLKTLYFALFADLIRVQRLYLRHNHIEVIENDTFTHMKELKYLDLSNNRLTILKNTTFYMLGALEEIVLTNNTIEYIEDHTFRWSLKLKNLDLSHNKLKQINSRLMTYNVKINHLKFGKNELTFIEKGAFSGLSDLKSIDLSFNFLDQNSIKNIDILAMKSLIISNNQLINLDEDIFHHFSSLQAINIDDCELKQLKEGIFLKNQNLIRITMQNNQLKEIHKETFTSTGILQELNLGGNLFTEFPHVALFNLSSLEILDLSHNQLESIDFFKFFGLQNLKHVSLSSNRISILTGFSSVVLKNLVTLNLSKNRLVILPTNFFIHSIFLKDIDLSFNLFKLFPTSALTENILPSLNLVNISNNPLVQLINKSSTKTNHTVQDLVISNSNLTIITSIDFDTYPRLKRLILQANVITRLSPGAFLKLNVLTHLDLGLNKLENLPRERLQGLYSLRYLNLSYNSLRELEEFTYGLKKLQTLDLSHNHLTKITGGVFNHLDELAELYLNGNFIDFLSDSIFESLNNIKMIDLRFNQLKIFSSGMLLSLEDRVKSLFIGGNPINCHCDAVGEWEWLNDHHKIILSGSSNLNCDSPEVLKGEMFLKMLPKRLCNLPIITRVAIQDIQPNSVIVSWQSRNVTGLNGFQIKYQSANSEKVIETKMADGNYRSTRLNGLEAGAKYKVCVVAVGLFQQELTLTGDFNQPVPSVDDLVRLDSMNSVWSTCTTIKTPDLYKSALDGTFSQTYLKITTILSRRLSLVVGSGFCIFVLIIVVATLRFVKKKKPLPREIIDDTCRPPDFITYTSSENRNSGCFLEEFNANITTISDKTSNT